MRASNDCRSSVRAVWHSAGSDAEAGDAACSAISGWSRCHNEGDNMTRTTFLAGVSFLAIAACGGRASATTFTFTGSVQTFTAPTSGVYDILAYGAQGGNQGSVCGGSDSQPCYSGGPGAEAGGDFHLMAGQSLSVIAGGVGGSGSFGAGGGGGSFVFTGSGATAIAFVVAGGGGGAGYPGNGSPGAGSAMGSSGGSASAGTGGAGGSPGSGGGGGTDQQFTAAAGGGGGGFYSGGTNGVASGAFAEAGGGGGPGAGSASGGASGNAGSGSGGFGGGGGSGGNTGGGGGGYGGGGGGAYEAPGGGGGTYLALSVPFNADFVDASGDLVMGLPAGLNGNGEVIINLVKADTTPTATPEPGTLALLVTSLITVLARGRRTPGPSLQAEGQGDNTN